MTNKIDEMFSNESSNSELSEQIENLKEAVRAVFNRDDMALKSSLSSKQVAHLIRASVYAERFKSPMMEKIISFCLELKVSDKGLGRKNLSEVLKSMLNGQQEPLPEDIKLRRKLFG